MSRDRALREAERIAASARRQGWPDAEPAPEYCLACVGPDKFYTYTVSVYMGDKQPTKQRASLQSAVRKFFKSFRAK